MKLIVVNLSLIYLFIHLEFTDLVCSSQSFVFENLQRDLSKSFTKNFRRFNFYNPKEHPQPLPKTTPSLDSVLKPVHNIYQGSRKPNDTRVFRRRFQYAAEETGHKIRATGFFDCIINHLAIETDGGTPYLLRGGVGYNFFDAVARAHPGQDLVGSVRAYCVRKDDDYYRDRLPYRPNLARH